MFKTLKGKYVLPELIVSDTKIKISIISIIKSYPIKVLLGSLTLNPVSRTAGDNHSKMKFSYSVLVANHLMPIQAYVFNYLHFIVNSLIKMPCAHSTLK